VSISNLPNTSTLSASAERVTTAFTSAVKSETPTESSNNVAVASIQVVLSGQKAPEGEENSTQALAPVADKQLETIQNQTQQGGEEGNNRPSTVENEALTKSLQQMSASVQARKLEFSTVEESGRTVVKVIDKENDDVIRQIPSEEFIQMAEKISELSQESNATQGLLFDSEV
jgi:flagellar protein FlaG